MDWDWLLKEAKQREIQNRLGYVVALARCLMEGQRVNSDWLGMFRPGWIGPGWSERIRCVSSRSRKRKSVGFETPVRRGRDTGTC